MTTRRIHVHSQERENEHIRFVRLWSDTDRARSSGGGYYKIKAVVRNGSKTDVLGEWSQKNHTLSASAFLSLTGGDDINYALQDGDVCAVEVEAFSLAPNLEGISVDWGFTRTGGVGPSGTDRVDGDFPSAAVVTKPLFYPGGQIADLATRDTVDSMVNTLNSSGVAEFHKVVALPDLFNASARDIIFDYDTGANVALLGGAATTVATVTVTGLDAAATYRIDVVGTLSCYHNGAADIVSLTINDGTTVHGRTRQYVDLGVTEPRAWAAIAQYDLSGVSSQTINLQAQPAANNCIGLDAGLKVMAIQKIGGV